MTQKQGIEKEDLLSITMNHGLLPVEITEIITNLISERNELREKLADAEITIEIAHSYADCPDLVLETISKYSKNNNLNERISTKSFYRTSPKETEGE